MFVQGSHTFIIFYALSYVNGHGSCAHMYVITYTRFTQNSTVGSMLTLHGSTIHVATWLGPKKAMNLEPLFEDFWTSFFPA